ncbi:hypothetical protein PG995_005571 [Apiospora arundinis]
MSASAASSGQGSLKDITTLLSELRASSEPITPSNTPKPRYVAPGPPPSHPPAPTWMNTPRAMEDNYEAPAMQQPVSAWLPRSASPGSFIQPPVQPDPSSAARPPMINNPRVSATTSKGYRGAWDLDRNVSANIPEDQNCSAYLTGLPPTLGYYDLLGSLQYGKVVQTHINPPGGRHRNSAAKVVFSDRAAAERLQAAVNDGSFGWPGSRVNFMWNRVKAAAQDPNDPSSRTIRVTGPRRYVNELDLCVFLWTRFWFDLEEIVTIDKGLHETTLEIRFGSLWFQSENAFYHLRSTHPHRDELSVEWSCDPCDLVDGINTASH